MSDYEIINEIIRYHIQKGKFPTDGYLYNELTRFKRERKLETIDPICKKVSLSYDPNFFDLFD